MKPFLLILLCASAVLAQTPPNRPEEILQTKYRQQGSQALSEEQTRSKASLCDKALPGGNAKIADCLAKEEEITEHNYLTYIRSIGALLRLPVDDSNAKIKNIPFDLAEDDWHAYRDESCKSMATQWEGGDQAPVAYVDCRLKLTWNHMNELSELYGDLWH
jgi:hypothetical protein